MKKRILLLGFMAFLVCVINNMTYAQNEEHIDNLLLLEEDVEDEDVEDEDVNPPIIESENHENLESELPNENPGEANSATSLEQTSPVEGSTDDSEDSSKNEDSQESSKDEDDKDSSNEKDNQDSSGEKDNQESSGEKDNQESSNEKDNQESSGEKDNQESSGEKDNQESSGEKDNQESSNEKDNQESSNEKDNQESSGEKDNQESSKNEDNTVSGSTGAVSSHVAEDDIASKKESTSPDSEDTIQQAGDNSKDTIQETSDNSEDSIQKAGGNSEDTEADGDKATNDSNTTPSSEETTQDTGNTTADSDDSSQENTTLDNNKPSSDEMVSNAAPVHWVKSRAGRRVIIVYLRANPNYTNTTKVTIIYYSRHGEVKVNYNDTLSYMPNDPNFVGEDSLTYSFTDQNGKTYRSTVKIVIKKKVDYEREADIAIADGQVAHTATTEPGVPFKLNIMANYKPKTQQTLTLNPSENSQVIDNQDGTLSYFPNQEFISGVDTFSYTVTNAVGQTKTFIIQVEVGEEDDESAEWSFSYQDDEDGPSTGLNYQTPLVTFYNIDPFIINYAEITTSYSRKRHLLTLIRSENSQTTFNRNGTITYIANPGFEGVDIFYYELFEKRTKITTTFTVKVTVKGEQEIPPVVPNTIYLVHDESVKDSQLLTVADPLGEDNTAKTLGPRYKGLDMEGLGIHPNTCRLYAASGSGPSNNLDGYLFLVHPQYGYLKIVGDTGYSELVSLAFRQDGTLWAGTAKGAKINPEGPGLIEIDPRTAKVLGFYSSPWSDRERKFEGLSWSSSDLVWGTPDEILYGTENQNLWAFHSRMNKQKKLCNNLPGEVEALETLNGGLLLFAIHNDQGNTVHVFDPVQCEEVDLGLEPVVTEGKGHRFFETAIDYNDLESIAWIPECQPKMEIPGPVVVNTDKNDNQSSAKKTDSKSAAKKTDSKSATKKDNSKSATKKDNSKSATKKDNSKSAANKNDSKSAANKNDSKSAAKKDNSKSAAKKDNSKSAAKKTDSKSATKKDNSKSAAKKDNSKSAAKKDNSKSAAKKDDSKSATKKNEDKNNNKSSDKKNKKEK